MSRFLAWLGLAIALLAGGALFVLARALDDQPLVARVDEPSAASVARAKAILRQHDPRRLPRNATREVRLAGADLEALLNLAARRGLHGKAAVQLHQGGADLRYTATLPAALAATGLGRFINVSARLGVSDNRLAVEQVRIGRVPLPAALFEAAVAAGIRHTDLAPEVALLQKTIARIAITPADLRLTYVWQPELLDSARGFAVSPAERERLAAAQRLLTATLDRVGHSRRQIPLADALGPLLQDAASPARSAAGRSAAWRDVLLVAALHLSGKNVALLIPEAARWPRPRPLTLTLRGRTDLAQHFVISAAVAAWAGESLAAAVGLDKEIDDANGGSGFSFVDLAADRAGTRLGELAAGQPERLAAALAAGLDDGALLPSIDGLPENMQADEFRRRFGGIDAPAYRQMSDEIDRRVAALALFR